MLSYKLDFNSCAIRDGFRKSNHTCISNGTYVNLKLAGFTELYTYHTSIIPANFLSVLFLPDFMNLLQKNWMCEQSTFS